MRKAVGPDFVSLGPTDVVGSNFQPRVGTGASWTETDVDAFFRSASLLPDFFQSAVINLHRTMGFYVGLLVVLSKRTVVHQDPLAFQWAYLLDSPY